MTTPPSDPRPDTAADTLRQRVLDALASLPPPARAYPEALHAEHFPPRADGGMVYRPADVLFHLAQGTRLGFPDEKIAWALGVLLGYLAAVRGAAGLAEPVRG